MSDAEPPDADLVEAAHELSARLIAAGWNPLDPQDKPEAPWYAERFQWAGSGAPQPQAKEPRQPNQDPQTHHGDP